MIASHWSESEFVDSQWNNIFLNYLEMSFTLRCRERVASDPKDTYVQMITANLSARLARILATASPLPHFHLLLLLGGKRARVTST